MRLLISVLIVLVTLSTGVAPVGAQSEPGSKTPSGAQRADEPLRGFVVAVHDSDLVVRGRDDRTYTISTAGVDASFVTRLMVGQPVKVTLRRGEPTEAPAAASVEFDTGPTRSYLIASGVVESTLGDRVQFRSLEGLGVPMDLGQLVGPKPDVRPGDNTTLIYEQTPQNPLSAVWIERSGAYPAASPRTIRP
jgi:hypothetical protein